MPTDEPGLFLARSLRYLQENVRRAGPAMLAGYVVLGSIVLLGGIGYALDVWRGTSPSFTVAGLLLGVLVGLFELAKIVLRK